MRVCVCVLPALDSLPVLLLLAVLSLRMSTLMLLKLLALVIAGLPFLCELSESVLLHGRGSRLRGSFSELLSLNLQQRKKKAHASDPCHALQTDQTRSSA